MQTHIQYTVYLMMDIVAYQKQNIQNQQYLTLSLHNYFFGFDGIICVGYFVIVFLLF